MYAGRMQYKITLFQPQVTTTASGNERTSYVNAGTVWAERVKASGRRSEEVGEHFPDYSVEFNIRDAHTVSENWRVQQLGGYLYTVTNVIPNLDRGYKTLVCVRVNE